MVRRKLHGLLGSTVCNAVEPQGLPSRNTCIQLQCTRGQLAHAAILRVPHMPHLCTSQLACLEKQMGS